MTLLAGCQGRVSSEQQLASAKLQHDYDVACTAGKCPCASPLGPIVDGGTAVAYDIAKVGCGKTCSSHVLTLTCKNGKFDRDITALNFSCAVDSCRACTAGNNQVPHGFTVATYNTQAVNCGASCDDAKRSLVCVDGTLQGTSTAPSVDGLDGTFKYGSCSPGSCSCSLPSGGTLTLGGSLRFYKSKTGTCDATCEDAANSSVRTCVNSGTSAVPNFGINGDTSFQYLACTGPSQAACKCVLPDAAKTTINHGDNHALFTTPGPANCMSCASQQITAYCGAGVLYDKPITDATKLVLTPSQLSSHANLSCDPTATKDCTINSLCIANNGSQTLYGKSTLVCGDDLGALTGVFSCTNKSLSKNGSAYNAGADPYAAVWQTSAPTNTCVGCVTPWKATVGNGVKVTAYKKSNISSNTCGGGCKSLEFTCTVTGGIGRFTSGDSSIDADIATNPANYTKECTNTCNEEGGGAPPRACLLPWQNSFVTPDTLIPMYNQRTAFCGDSCQNHFKVGRCQMATGTFDAGLTYIYQSCTELACGTLKVTSIAPTFLPPAGGVVTVSGTGFAAGLTLKMGSKTCASVNVTNATTATCTLPAGTGLFQDVVAKLSSQTAILPRSFSFYSGTCSAGPGSKVFKFANTLQAFTVPAGCSKVLAQVWGAGGSGHFSLTGSITQFGGSGGYAEGAIPVTPAQPLTIAVGGGGAFWNYLSAAGGGYSGVFSSTTMSAASALMMAGGGGGAGDPTGCNANSTGGEGGGNIGGTHGACSGLGGSQSAGGAGGPGAAAGTSLAGAKAGGTTVQGGYLGGGSGGSSLTGGGGGGGGYFGGGAGAEAASLGGAGGGGSGYLAPSVTSGNSLNGSGSVPPNINDPNYIAGVGTGGGIAPGGNGLIVISW